MAADDRGALPRIALIATGGTIGLVGRDRLDLVEYVEFGRFLEPAELLARVPEAAAIARIDTPPFKRIPSSRMQPADWTELGRLIWRCLDAGAQGIAITHGTSTLEETAYFLHLTLQTDRPIVLTGAMRPSNGLSQDGDLNLLNAIRLAAGREAVGMGVLVVLNDEISTARDVAKTDTHRVQTFRSQDLGLLGHADTNGEIVFYRAPLRRHTLRSEFDVRQLETLPRVDIVYSYVGEDGTLVRAAVEHGAEGIVVAGTGAGMVTEEGLRELLRARERGVAVVLSSRCGSGRVTRTTRARQAGFVAADSLTPQKARILLALALTRTRDPDAVQRFFDEY